MPEQIELICGDCLVELPKLAENSVHSIVTDPPYELGFMGKSWDSTGIAYNVEVWRECFRILHPGGYLLAFGGSRTYHRLACAIEDAGFILHPLIGYIFGVGFPKAVSLSKAFDREAHKEREVVGRYIIPADSAAGNRGKVVRSVSQNGGCFGVTAGKEGIPITALATPAARLWDGWFYGRQSLKPAIEPICMAQRPPEGRMTDNVLKWNCGGINIDKCRVGIEAHTGGSSVSSLLGLREANEEMAQSSKASEMASDVRDGMPLQAHVERGESALEGRKVGLQEGGLRLSPRGYIAGIRQDASAESIGEASLGTSAGDGEKDRKATTDNGNGSSCQRGQTRQQGRKPLPLEVGRARQTSPNAYEEDGAIGSGKQNLAETVGPAGRWPANLITDGSDEVLAEFPRTHGAGAKRSGGLSIQGGEGGLLGVGNHEGNGARFGDSGSAARFFYCAKASRAEREMGLEGMEPKPAGAVKSGDGGWRDEEDRGRKPRHNVQLHARNHHPCVKPLALLRYLCRLVTPTGGTVLDPFAGSGTTGMACVAEGFAAILIEKEAEYVEIARRRIGKVANENTLFDKRPCAVAV